MRRHRFVNAYELRDAVLYCGCGSNVCIRLPSGTRSCPLIGRVDPEEAQVAAADNVERIRETILHGTEWMRTQVPVPRQSCADCARDDIRSACSHAAAVVAPPLTHVNAWRTLHGFPRVASIVEHEADMRERGDSNR